MISTALLLPRVLPLVLALAPALADPSVSAEFSFEVEESGTFLELESSVGLWNARSGQVDVDDKHARTGSKCLHLHSGETDGESSVELTLPQAAAAGDAVSFWIERWTSRSPFAFQVQVRGNGAWRTVYDGKASVKVGGFSTEVRLELAEGDLALRYVCTAPAGTGVLIDDVTLEPNKPMELVSTSATTLTLPVLLGNRFNPILQVSIVTSGRQEPLLLEELAFEFLAGDLLRNFEHIEVFAADDSQNSNSPPQSMDDVQRLGAIHAAEAGQLVFHANHALHAGTNLFWLSVTTRAGANLDGRLSAGCSSVRIAGKQHVPATTSAGQAHARLGIALRRAGDNGVHTYRIPGLVTTPKGTLIAVYDVRWRSGGDLPGDIDVGLSRSTDGGRTWAPMEILMDMGKDPEWNFDGVGDPSLLVDRNTGRIFVLGTWSHGNRSWRGSGPGLEPADTGQLMLVHSDDEGETWSAPRNLTSMLKKPEWSFLLQGPGRGITMGDGTLVFPAQFLLSAAKKRLPHSTVITSRDHGETWEIGTGMRGNTTEAAVVELDDGRLMLNARDNRGGSRSIYTSVDLGKTWEAHGTSRGALIEPVCMASLIHIGRELNGQSNGMLLFSNPAVDRAPRRRTTIKASLDSGSSWDVARSVLLDEGGSAGYSCLTMIDAETIGILYESSRAHLVFQRVPLVDVLVSGD